MRVQSLYPPASRILASNEPISLDLLLRLATKKIHSILRRAPIGQTPSQKLHTFGQDVGDTISLAPGKVPPMRLIAPTIATIALLLPSPAPAQVLVPTAPPPPVNQEGMRDFCVYG